MPGKKLCLLALDGGGFRGLSSLLILRQIMEAINPKYPPKPCDYFDMICGTSTGGLSAIMLGRLRMTVDDCIDAYISLSHRVFQKRRHNVTIRGRVQGRFDSQELEAALKDIIVKQGLEEDALLKDSPSAKCKVFVCATSKGSGDTVRLTSYRPQRRPVNLFGGTKIWEAARATSAASSLFDPIMIDGSGEKFVGDTTGANNPIYELWNEAQDIWPEPLEGNIKCLVSIGAGLPSLKCSGDDFIEIARTLMDIAAETESTAERFILDNHQLESEGCYYRFNVIGGLEYIGLEESHRKNTIVAATLRYLESQYVLRSLQSLSKHNKSSAVASSNDRVGRKAYKARKWTQAVELLRKALEEKDRHQLDTDETAETRRYYAQALFMAGKYGKAKDELENIVSWAERRFGPGHPETLKKRMLLGDAMEACRLSMSASEQFKLAALGFERASNGADTPDSLRCQYKHGVLASDHEAYDREWPYWASAEESLRRAAQGLAKLPGSSEAEVFKARAEHAKVLLKMCRDREALGQFTELLNIAKRKSMPRDTVRDLKSYVKECEFWLDQPAAVRCADRLPVARARATELQRQKNWRRVAGHW